jgi:hypothetical protein
VTQGDAFAVSPASHSLTRLIERLRNEDRRAAALRPRSVGTIGTDVFEVPFGGRVTVDVELSEPGYAYLLTLNANGKEQLLWPVNEAVMVWAFPVGKKE